MLQSRWLAAVRWCGVGLGLAGVLAAAGCSSDARSPWSGSAYHGAELTPALAKPDFTLTDTEGRAFHFADDTRGTLTLLFFGYTYCPDVCPVHMANIAAVLKTLPYEDQQRVRVVFVTTDPRRDTPARLRTWLDNFDQRFIGLRGTESEVHQIEASLGLPGSIVAPGATTAVPADSAYEVGHAAQVLAFTRDDSLRVMYPFGTRQQDWAADLPKLLAVGGKGR